MKNLLMNAVAHSGRFRAALVVGATLGLGLPHATQAQQLSPVIAVNQLAGVKKLSNESYRVWVSNPAAQRGELRLVDASTGKVLYEEYSSKESFGRQFDVRHLPDGQYTFEVKLGQQEFRYLLHLQTTSQRLAELSADTTPNGRRPATRL